MCPGTVAAQNDKPRSELPVDARQPLWQSQPGGPSLRLVSALGVQPRIAAPPSSRDEKLIYTGVIKNM